MNFKKYEARLPDVYQEVEYIQTDGAAYIDTGYVPKINDVYTIKFSEQSGTENAVVFGSRSSGTYSTSTNQVYLNLTVDTQGQEIRFYQGINPVHLQSREVDTLIELTLSVTSDGGYDNQATQPIYLFVLNNFGTAVAQSRQSLIKIYGFSVTNGSLKHSFVPCYRKSDNAIGMYDIVTDSFFANSDTGSFSKGNDVNTWHDIPHYIHNTSTDTFTTLPADIYADGNNATVGISGNTVQNGTPSPTTPIQPQGTGERTGNLLDYTAAEDTPYATVTQISGGISVSGSYFAKFRTVQFVVGRTYTMSWKSNTISGTPARSWRFQYADNTYSNMGFNGRPLTAEKEVIQLLLYISTGSSCIVEFTEIMLNEGSTPKPYEPYGYKIPILSNNTTTPVYLGGVETTRRVRKWVLDGTENWTHRGGYPPNEFFIEISNINFINNLAISTHYLNQDSGSFDELQENHIIVRISSSGDKTYIGLRDGNFPATVQGANQLKEWLAQQYANGTPVTIWYVLAEPETGIVSEPLMKIGEYADTVSGITIPTITSKDTFDVDTTLKPSELSLSYTGWHDATVEEWDGSQWNE